MQISGVTKFSLIEYPGEMACIVFTPGCNLRCRFCHNPEFVLPEQLRSALVNLIPEEAFLNFLEKRQGILTGVSICGGEPTIQKDIKDFCRKIKNLGYKIKLDTNGRDPSLIQDMINEGLLDYVAMDVKHINSKLEGLVGNIDINEYLKTINLLLDSNIDYEFRTTLIKGIHSEEDIEEMSKIIAGAKNYYLQKFRKGKTLDNNFEGEEFTNTEIEDFIKIAKKYIDNVGVRY